MSKSRRWCFVKSNVAVLCLLLALASLPQSSESFTIPSLPLQPRHQYMSPSRPFPSAAPKVSFANGSSSKTPISTVAKLPSGSFTSLQSLPAVHAAAASFAPTLASTLVSVDAANDPSDFGVQAVRVAFVLGAVGSVYWRSREDKSSTGDKGLSKVKEAVAEMSCKLRRSLVLCRCRQHPEFQPMHKGQR